MPLNVESNARAVSPPEQMTPLAHVVDITCMPYPVRKFCATLIVAVAVFPSAERAVMFTVRTCNEPGGKPVSTTPGWLGTTSSVRPPSTKGSGISPGSLDVSVKGAVPPWITSVFFTPAYQVAVAGLIEKLPVSTGLDSAPPPPQLASRDAAARPNAHRMRFRNFTIASPLLGSALPNS
jgi:hypothetical protein